MLSFKTILFISSLLLAGINTGFFIYSSKEIYSLKDGISGDDNCKEYFEYCIGTTGSFLLTLIVVIFFLCCNSLCSITLYGVNCFIIVSLCIDKYVRRKYMCNEECANNCHDLNNFGDVLEKFSYGNLAIIGSTLLYISGQLLYNICHARNQGS